MEFPDFGKHCAYKDCKQLDFLPIECDNCRAMFCKDHSRIDSHQCVSSDVISSEKKLVRNFKLLIQFNLKMGFSLVIIL